MKALILSAGYGTRLQPLTNSKPKALVEVNGVTLLEIVIRKLIAAGFNEIIVNTHHFADQIITFLEKNNYGINIKVSDEKELLLDTGGGIKKASWFFNDGNPFLVHNVDILSDFDLNELYNYHIQNNSIATLAIQNRKSSRYFLFDEEKTLCGWRNDRTGEEIIGRNSKNKLIPFAFSGIHILQPEVFDLMPSEEVFSVVKFYLAIAKEHRITYFDHTNSLFIDLGKKENLEEAERVLKNKN